ncbi:MAG: GNAT family N-acetyltransferase [Actinobacteria bacterium]|nr:GNAT family N-acetyltransferase [Actinomycetota bacterium]
MSPPPASEYDEEDDVPGDAPSPRPGPPPHLAELTLTTLTADRFEEFHRAAERGFQEEAPPEFLEAERAATEPERFFGFTVDGRWVSTFGSVRRMLTVPGGAAVPMSGVTAVTVHSAYRRRGLLRRAMAREFELARTRGETIAALYASESGIYGRFGYGVATAKYLLSGRTDALALRPDVAARLDAAGGSVDEVPGGEFVGLVANLHERLRARRPGSLDRPRAWWAVRLSDPPAWRNGATALRYVICYDATGRIDGFATYRVKGGEDDAGNPAGQVLIGEVEAVSPTGYARLWRYLADLDLVRTFRAQRAALDEPLLSMVADPRAIVTRREDGLYVRLLDVAAALAIRRYAAPIDIVIEVRDEVLPEQAGRYRVRAEPVAPHTGGSGTGSFGAGRSGAADAENADAQGDLVTSGLAADVARVDAAPNLTLSVRELGAAYLGGTSLGALHAAGLIDEHCPGAVARASAAFGWPIAPFCADMF